jgi:hypothetical protein
MQLPRPLPLSIIIAALLAASCGTDNKKSKAPDAPPVLPIAPTEKNQKCTNGQVLDADTNACRNPTERECLERNMVFYGLTCDVYFPPLPNDSVNAPKITFDKYCEKNAAGAFVNCKDGEYALPVSAIPHVEGTPEAYKTLAVDQEIKLQFAIKNVGEVKLTLDNGSEPIDLLKPAGSAPWLLRNLKVGDSIPMKLTFAPGTVIHDKSEIRFSHQFASYHDKSQILEGITSKIITNKWLAEETERQRKARMNPSTLNSEWLSFLMNDVKGDVVWTFKDKCPADQQRSSLGTSVCLVDQTIDSKPNWKNLYFIYTCITPRPITISYGQERYGLLNYGRFQNEPFTILIPKNLTFLGQDCFLKIVE